MASLTPPPKTDRAQEEMQIVSDMITEQPLNQKKSNANSPRNPNSPSLKKELNSHNLLEIERGDKL